MKFVSILFCCCALFFAQKCFAMDVAMEVADHCCVSGQEDFDLPASITITSEELLAYLRDSGSILVSFLKKPTEVAALTSSSPWVVKTILGHVQPGNILEIGAGAGAISGPLVKRLFLAEDTACRFDAVELQQDLFGILAEKVAEVYGDKHRFFFLNKEKDKMSIGSKIFLYKANFVGWEPELLDTKNADGFYDTIISTVPMTRLPIEVMEQILVKVNKLLKPGGVFIYVSLFGARSLGTWLNFVKSLCCDTGDAREYEQKLDFIDNWVADNFEKNEVVVWSNITPMRVYWAVKKGAAAPEAQAAMRGDDQQETEGFSYRHSCASRTKLVDVSQNV